jgi:hypothetical protein
MRYLRYVCLIFFQGLLGYGDIKKTVEPFFPTFEGYSLYPEKIDLSKPPFQGLFAKVLLHELYDVPLNDRSSRTYVRTGRHKNPHKNYIVLKSRGKFGSWALTLDKKTLSSLEKSARIFIHPDVMTPSQFIAIQKILHAQAHEKQTLFIKEQDRRSLETVIQNIPKKHSILKKNCFSLPALNTSVSLLASGIAHIQHIHWLVEAKPINGIIRQTLRTTLIDKTPPTTLISIPALNLSYGNIHLNKISDEKEIKAILIPYLKRFWQTLLYAAKHEKIDTIYIPPVGLGAFFPHNLPSSIQEKIAELYIETFILCLKEMTLSHVNIIYHPGKFQKIFQNILKKHPNIPIQLTTADVKLMSMWDSFYTKNKKVALVNPSDPDVMWGVYDVGEYYKNGHYAMEEDIASTSTAVLGSAGLNDVYRSCKRVFSVKK